MDHELMLQIERWMDECWPAGVWIWPFSNFPFLYEDYLE
jgi:hypothetical protein